MARKTKISRRGFLKASGAAAAGFVAGCNVPRNSGSASSGSNSSGGIRAVAIDMDPMDGQFATPAAQWGIAKLRAALAARSIDVVPADAFPPVLITVAGGNSSLSRQMLNFAHLKPLSLPESAGIVPLPGGGATRGLLVTGGDGNGLSYALTELAEQIRLGDPAAALFPKAAVVEQPANKVRSICRVFVSEEEDKPWYYDRAGWQQYFDMLATNRFNKFNLSLGLAYDFSDNVVDGYFYFAYPFFLRLPGYDVRAVDRNGKPLPGEEQDRNLETLQFISAEAAKRGIHFQLGLWTHSIKWPLNSGVTANYTLAGITPATQALYSRDALKMLLEACPDIEGVTIRTHGESGVPEGDISLWKTVFEGTQNLAGSRKVQIDLHAKGVTFEIIDAARATGNPVIVTPKFWAEHNGLPYIPASIREWELPKANTGGLMSLSTGSRNHMRYGYGDILTNDRQYGVVTRVFPGTQRFLLWGDPVFAREYAKAFTFNRMDGVEFFEPLAFKGRQGTGMARNRSCYADAQLKPKWPDQMDKYEYTFRLWGRTAYNPDVSDEVLLRASAAAVGSERVKAMKAALSPASRILPLVTAAHSPSAAQANFWPEIYTNMSHYDPTRPTYNDDTPSPKIFGTVSALDPQLFATANESADALLAGHGLGKITVMEVAEQLYAWAAQAMTPQVLLSDLLSKTAVQTRQVQLRRAIADSQLLAAMGRFWAAKFRTGVLYAIFDKSGYEPAREAALGAYRSARDAMAEAAALAKGVYIDDISFGADRKIRGTFADRLPAIDADIAGMRTATPRSRAASADAAAAALRAAGKPVPRPKVTCDHTPTATFTPGAALPIAFRISAPRGTPEVRLWYRHVNQAERYVATPMQRNGDTFTAEIPAAYTQSPYALQYYGELDFGPEGTALLPGFREDFLGTPYFVVLQPAPPPQRR